MSLFTTFRVQLKKRILFYLKFEIINMNWLNYHHLYYFYTIAQVGSMTKAAIVLKVGQSALSLQLKQFEEQAGELFERKGKGRSRQRVQVIRRIQPFGPVGPRLNQIRDRFPLPQKTSQIAQIKPSGIEPPRRP
jgi:hypothetical protein